MNKETRFIKDLEAYLNEDFSEFTKKKILSMLLEYKDISVNKKVKEVKQIIKLVPEKIAKYKVYVTNDILLADAKELCELHEIDIDLFLKAKYRKGTNDVTELRKQFCIKMFERYLCSNNILAEFFKVHHSTISFYLYGKKYNPIIHGNVGKNCLLKKR
jgi:phenylalanyl-tRNA synthetase alpha subunit